MIKRLLISLAYPLVAAALYFGGFGIAHAATPQHQWVMAIGFGALILGVAMILGMAAVGLRAWWSWIRND